MLDQLCESRLSTYTWRANDSDDDGGRLLGQAVNQRNMEPLFFNLERISILLSRAKDESYIMRARCLLLQTSWVGVGKGFGIRTYAVVNARTASNAGGNQPPECFFFSFALRCARLA